MTIMVMSKVAELLERLDSKRIPAQVLFSSSPAKGIVIGMRHVLP